MSKSLDPIFFTTAVEVNHVGENHPGSVEDIQMLLESKGYVLDTTIGKRAILGL
jgi:hypothetical protein